LLWIAIWDGGQVRRHAPDGQLLAVVELPVDRPTSCAFGGRDLDQLYVTTSRYELAGAQPLAGAVFCLEPGVSGKPSPPAAIGR
jgi:sugar lactone lactonase YvrE